MKNFEKNNINISSKTIGFLQNILKNNLKSIKRYYKKIVFSVPDSQNEQVLYENYYIIEKITKILLKENINVMISANSDNIPVLGKLILDNCSERDIPSTEELISLFNKSSSERYISNAEYELLIWQFRYAILISLSNIFKEVSNDKFSALDLIVLLTKSDTFNMKAITHECNPLEKIYDNELSEIYPKMDEPSKCLYRNRTSEIAQKLSRKEFEVASEFIEKANKAKSENCSEKEHHIGFYINNRYNEIFKRINFKSYIGLIVIITFLLCLFFSVIMRNYWLWIFLYFPLWEFSKLLTELTFTSGQKITYLPRYELKGQVPEGAETLLTVSTLITSPKDIIKLKEKLIRLHYSNLSENIKICALCDLKQSTLPSTADDRVLVRNSSRIIKKLNEKFDDRFVLILRKRTYSKTQRIFSGYERKRGAIEQLIRFIKNEKIEFLNLVGNTDFLKKVKFVVSLDYDTKALVDTIPELVSIAIHPLNKPEIENGKVVRGYGIIAPKVTTKLKSSLKSPFSKLVGGIGSSCAYDIQCSNLYQDTFDEGIFAGKGIINVDAFYQICCDIFPSEEVLSHDILEGELLRTGFAGDIEFSDGFPSTALSYFKRMHRWIRGDIQNISFISKKFKSKNNTIDNPINALGRFKLFDNVRRSIFPINIILLFFLTFLVNRNIGLSITLIAFFSLTIPYLCSFLNSVFYNGFYSISRKYYSNIASQTSEILSQGLFSLLLLPQQAIISADAVIRALWRKYVSKKNLLEWTTSAQTEKSTISISAVMQMYIIPEAISIALLFSSKYFLKIISLIYLFSPIIIIYTNTPYKLSSTKIKEEKRLEISSQLTAMWQLYEDYATSEHNFLPPDNVQFAPVFRVCRRTSPTNIGLMMLSILIARDFDLIDTRGLFIRLDRTLSSVEKLEKYKGNLYNWYDTSTLKLSSNPFVSTVDSGNFVCCMTSLKEGLKDYKSEYNGIDTLIERINALIDNTDIGTFYDESKGLLTIGYNPVTKKYSPHHYDLLMSEARMTSYFAIAKRQIPKKHWRMLGRTMAQIGLYSGPVSYSGTMFEYFMPELMLISEHGSLSFEGLKFCLFCQKKRAKENNVPFGISESGYFAFDNALNYQYKAHGVQKLGLKKGLDNELVVSPYSAYLALQYDFDASFSNLERLKKHGMYGNYGFYEAIDFTNNKNNPNGSIIKSYMAHHVGMSILSVANSLHNGRIQQLFFKDYYMKSTDELLQEKVMAGAVVFDDINKKPEIQKIESEEADKLYFENVHPLQPNVKLLCNGEYTLAISDIGASVALYQGNDVYQRTTDVLRRPEGCYFAIEDENEHYCMTYLPEYINDTQMSVEFDENTASFFRNSHDLRMGMKIHLHNNLPCEIRQFAIKNTSNKAKEISLLSYIQPVLATYENFAAHPAFSKLFLKESYDLENKIVIVSRKSRNSNDEIFCAVGFLEDVDLFCNLSREEILSRPDGVTGVFKDKINISQNYNSIPDPSIFIKTSIQLLPNEKTELNLFILMSLSKDELYQNIARLRHDKVIYTLPSSMISAASIEGRLINVIFPQILFKKFDCKEIINSIETNKLSACSLWGLGVSGDLPIVLVEVDNINGIERIVGYIKCHNILKLCGIKFDLVFTFNDKGEYERRFYNMLVNTINRYQLGENISTFGGIHLIDTVELDSETINLLKAVSVHIAPPSMIRILAPIPEFNPVTINPVEKVDIDIQQKLSTGGFNENEYVIDKETNLPWCNVIANPIFGTLVSNSSLGYSYAINSRENKLTPWENDARSDNRGEIIIIKVNNKYYDAVLGSTAVFSPQKAIYYGKCELFESKVTVSVAEKGMCKKIELELKWSSKNVSAEIAYYTEPVLGVSRDNSRMIVFSSENDMLIAKNPLNKDVHGFMTIACSKKPSKFITNRDDFLSGRWNNNSLSSTNFPCGAVIVKSNAIRNTTQNFNFYLSFGTSLKSAIKMPSLFEPLKCNDSNQISIETPDKNLNYIFNTWLNRQALAGRIYARTGFYQNSGAWGFRDQLQDACCCLLKNPDVTKRQIARACTAQFPEGDVLHWWHKLPNKTMRGVRTKYSDDLVWLPYTVCEYIEKTSDYNILAVNIAYCEGIELPDGKHEIYGEVTKSEIIESVYNHCKKALNQAFKIGEHNLILMGCGDWNDSFNNVGVQGKGESIWLSEFMIIVLRRFSQIAEYIGDMSVKNEYIEKANLLAKAVEDNCWDGEWYIRAYFDNAEELGSKNSPACQIDSLAQSFAVLAELPNTERNMIALNSAYSYLVDEKNGLIKLFNPAFDKDEMPVGYATAYPRGIRENGGQYTHGAIWLAIAFLQAGKKKKGYELIKLLNPANKYLDEKTALIFKNEPYFMTADIYTNPQCYGRGGWSIYTGAAAWYYRAIFEWFLGVKIRNGFVTFNPCLPDDWNEYEINIDYNYTKLHIVVVHGTNAGMFDNDKPFERIQLDKLKHEVRIIISD